MPRTEQQPPAGEPLIPPLTETEILDSKTAKRSLRARLAGGPVLQAIGRADTAGMRFVRRQARSRRATAVVRRYSHLGEHGGAWIAIGLAGVLVDRRNRQEWASGLAGSAPRTW